MKTISIVDKKSKTPIWSVFGLPAKIVGKDKYEIIKKFASCKSCYQTYSYSSTTSTLSHHKCPMLVKKDQSKLKNFSISSSTSNTSPVVLTRLNAADIKTMKVSEKQKSSFVTLLSDWVCSSVRPVSIIEDSGLIDLIDHCIQIGRSFVLSNYILTLIL